MGSAAAPVGIGLATAAIGVASGGTALPMIGLGLSAMSATSSVMGGMTQAGAYKAQATETRQQERQVALQAQSQEAERMHAYTQVMANNKAMAGGRNIGIDSPSEQALNNANLDVLSRSMTYMRANAAMNVQRLEAAAQGDDMAAPAAMIGGVMQGASSLYSGIDAYQKTQVPATSAILGPLAGSPTLAP